MSNETLEETISRKDFGRSHPARPEGSRSTRLGSWSDKFWLLLVACSGIVVSLVLSNAVYRAEQHELKTNLDQRAKRAVAALKREVDAELLMLQALAGFYEASDSVDRDKFATFVRKSAGQARAIGSLEYVPRVKAADRSSFEEAVRREGFPGFQIMELDTGGRWIPAAQRDEYFPVHRMHPLEKNRLPLGWDMGSHPDRLMLLKEARDGGRMVASGRLALVGDDLHEPSFLVMLPVYRQDAQTDSIEARRANLLGFCRAVFRVRDLVAVSLGDVTPAALDIQVWDKSAPREEQLLISHTSGRGADSVARFHDIEDAPAPLYFDAIMNVAQREWLIRVVPAPALLAQHETWPAWLALVAGLLFTGLMTVYVGSVQKASRRAIEARHSIERAQEALGESEERFRSVVQTAGDAIISINSQGSIVLWNTGAEIAFGYSSEEMIGKPLTAIMPERFRELHREGLKRRVAADESSFVRKNIELAGLRRNGTEFPVELSLSGWNTAEGKFFTGILRDTTDRKRAEADLIEAREAAEQASRAKSEFLANMSHEIRTPINGIVGMTELALNTDLTVEQREYMEAVKVSADSLVNLVNDILDFSKIEAGKLDLIAVDFSLRDAIADTMTVLAVQANKKGLELVYDIPLDMPDAFVGDPGRLKQVLVNLVGNAIKFTHEGQVSVQVRIESENHEGVILHFSVSDTGIGIPSDKLGKIFGAFEQADTSTTRRYGGTGLGLSLSRRLVEMMGGHIWVESEEAKGSTFHFTGRFMYQRAPVTATVSEREAMLKGVRVLVVDDNAANRRILEKTLLHWGVVPTVVDNGFAALAALELAAKNGRPYPVVLTDCMMPEMDGFELVERINAAPLLHASAVIMCTSGERGDGRLCMDLAVAGYLTKPIKQSDLLYTISTVLKQPKAVADRKTLITRHSIRESKRRLRILLAEDNPVNRKVAVKILEKMGHTVSVAEDGKQALEISADEQFDLILMDVQMPNMDGLEATRAIRTRENTLGIHIPVVAMTARAMKGDEEECLAAGMDGYISKPIDIQELSKAIDNLIVATKTEEQALPQPHVPWFPV